MSDPLTTVLSGGAGIVLGAIFFGGLWYTVRRAMSSRRPALWFLCSLLLRMGIALAGFYLVGKDDWRRMLACLAGFIVARFAVIWVTRQSSEIGKEAGHAP
jgi:F1F0 ATPase subunit 2